MTDNNNNFYIERITRLHDVSKLSLGSSSFTPLKIFLKRHAFDFHQYEIGKTFVLVNPEYSGNRVFGYITLITGEIFLNEDRRPVETSKIFKYESFPAAKIARLALDKSLQGKGFGQRLLDWSMNHLRLNVMPNIGCRYLIVDSKQESVFFYQKNGFVFVDENQNNLQAYPMMLLDLYRPKIDIDQNSLTDKSNELAMTQNL